jgi:hypothetical protein
VLLESGCTKPVAAQPKQTKAEPTQAERVAAIDAILTAGPTGRPGDADQRAALRVERTRLTGSSPIRPMAKTAVVAPAKPQQTSQPPQIIVAHNSQATSDKDWEATKAAVDQHSQKMQNLNAKHWHPGISDGHGHYISQREFQQSVNREADRLVQPQN